MNYQNMVEGVFLSRPNRFVAWVRVEGREVLCHVKNTGRCRELLIPGARVMLEYHDSSSRKTKYSLISVWKGGRLINMDSQAPNQAAAEWVGTCGLFGGKPQIKREKTWGNSRFDLYIETEGRKIFMEVKGVTLEEDGIARFPDAPTERGIKHLKELAACIQDGYEAYMLFVIQMKGVRQFEANERTHPQFKQALGEAARAGVHVLAYDCQVTETSLCLDSPILALY